MSCLESLSWDSAFFGFGVGRIAQSVPTGQLSAAVGAAEERGLRCIYLLAGADDAEKLDAAQRLGFRVRDIRVELERPVEGHPASSDALRRGSAVDLTAIEPIAREQFRSTRFFKDAGFPRDRSEDMYVQWLRDGLAGDSDRVTLIAPEDHGFVLCSVDPESSVGTVELIAVAHTSERQGLGGKLLAGAGAVFADADARTARVVTQGSNVAAQRLYQRFGYLTRDVSVWLHWWANE